MEWLKISTTTELVRIQTADIVFIQADGNYSDVYLFDGKPQKLTFKLHFFDEVLGQLARGRFLRVGKSLIVNTDYINSINLTTQELLLKGQHLKTDFKLRASKDALKELKTVMDNAPTVDSRRDN